MRQCRNSRMVGIVAAAQNFAGRIAVSTYETAFCTLLLVRSCLPDPIGTAYAFNGFRQGGHR
jgi:hypothetical protein